MGGGSRSGREGESGKARRGAAARGGREGRARGFAPEFCHTELLPCIINTRSNRNRLHWCMLSGVDGYADLFWQNLEVMQNNHTLPHGPLPRNVLTDPSILVRNRTRNTPEVGSRYGNLPFLQSTLQNSRERYSPLHPMKKPHLSWKGNSLRCWTCEMDMGGRRSLAKHPACHALRFINTAQKGANQCQPLAAFHQRLDGVGRTHA